MKVTPHERALVVELGAELCARRRDRDAWLRGASGPVARVMFAEWKAAVERRYGALILETGATGPRFRLATLILEYVRALPLPRLDGGGIRVRITPREAPP